MVSVEKKKEEKKVSQSQTLLEIALEKKTNKAEQRDREKKMTRLKTTITQESVSLSMSWCVFFSACKRRKCFYLVK